MESRHVGTAGCARCACGERFVLLASIHSCTLGLHGTTWMSLAVVLAVTLCVYAGGAWALWGPRLLNVVKEDFPRCCTTVLTETPLRREPTASCSQMNGLDG